MTFQELEQELPAYFFIEHFEKKPCGCLQEENVKYELKIKLTSGTDINGQFKRRYLIFYEPKTNLYWSKSPKPIGEHLGQGVTADELDIEIQNLKSKIK